MVAMKKMKVILHIVRISNFLLIEAKVDLKTVSSAGLRSVIIKVRTYTLAAKNFVFVVFKSEEVVNFIKLLASRQISLRVPI